MLLLAGCVGARKACTANGTLGACRAQNTWQLAEQAKQSYAVEQLGHAHPAGGKIRLSAGHLNSQRTSSAPHSSTLQGLYDIIPDLVALSECLDQAQHAAKHPGCHEQQVMRLPERWRKQLLLWVQQLERSLGWLLEVQHPTTSSPQTGVLKLSSLSLALCFKFCICSTTGTSSADLDGHTNRVCAPCTDIVPSIGAGHIPTCASTIQRAVQELSPWFRWLVYQALLTLLLRALVKRIRALEPYLEALALI